MLICEGTLFNNFDGTGTFQGSLGSFVLNVPVTIAKTSDSIVVECKEAGKDFVLTAKTTDEAYSFEYVNATGTLAEYMVGMTLSGGVEMIDNFESYTETGLGYDNYSGSGGNKDLSKRSGLRGSYFSDYYSGGSGSPLGGDGWSLMGSSDYLSLDKTTAHSGSNSAKYKYNSTCAMRLVSWGLYDGTAEPFSKATTFSFWVKGVEESFDIKVRVFSVPKIDKTTHVSDSVSKVAAFTIPANSDWTEYTVSLDSSKIYYGFTFTTQANYKNTRYFNVDDICVYSESPWEN